MINFQERLKHLGQITEIGSEQTLSGAQLLSAVEAQKLHYRNQGLKPGDRVLVRHANNIQFFVEILALLSLGACAVPVDSKNPQALHAENSAESLTAGHLVLYTSGTTGLAKEVCLSLSSLENKITTLENTIPAIETARTLCVLPTHFGHGLIANCLFPLLTGRHLFIAPAFSTQILFSLPEIVDRHEITFLSSVPSIWRILEFQTGPRLQTLKRIHCASAPFTHGLFSQLSRWAPSARIFNVFGTTELGSWVSGHEIKSSAEEAFVGIGWGCEIKLITTDENGYGRVSIKLSNESLWQETGDIGCWDKAFGLRLIGRTDDIINNGGIKVHPSEVEIILNLHPQLASCCVFSLPHQISGECVAAAVVLKENSELNPQELESWCREKLAGKAITTDPSGNVGVAPLTPP